MRRQTPNRSLLVMPNYAMQRSSRVGAAAALAAWAQEATLKFAPEDLPVPSPPIADCAMDFRERGRPIEQPVDPAHVADLRTALDLDIRGIEPEGLAGIRMLEPVCFYLFPDDRILLREGRGIEFYFRKIPRWIPDPVDFPRRQNSQ